MKITDAGNTYNYAIHILKTWGYQVSYTDDDFFMSEVNEESFKSEDPLSLLSMVYLKDEFVEEWRRNIHIDNSTLLAFNHLILEGFAIEINNKYSEEWFNFVAKKEDLIMIAESSLSLLGLFLILKEFGYDWRNTEITNYCAKILE